jgi:hypothetical protein
MRPASDLPPPVQHFSDRSSSHYRLEDGLRVVDIKASDAAHLFSGLDPSPFGEKDLDDDVEAYIIDAVTEIGGPDRAKLVFHLAGDALDEPGLTNAVHNFFAYRSWVAGRSLERLLRTGYMSLAIGLAFLFLCLGVRRFLAEDAANATASILSEGLLILGWVAMWRPVELFLYDWWPIWRRRRLYKRLRTIRVEWRKHASAENLGA